MQKELTKKYPMLGSSVDAEQISLTIKSAGLALIPIALAVCRAFDCGITENDLVQLINAVATITAMVGVVYGVLRKFKK